MSIADYIASVIRTVVPVVVGTLAANGLDIDSEALTVVVIGLYYSLVRLAEEFEPTLGWLLGLRGTPEYAEGE